MGVFADSLGQVNGKANLTTTTLTALIAAPTNAANYLSVTMIKAVNFLGGADTEVNVLADAVVVFTMVCNAASGEILPFPNGWDLPPGAKLDVQATVTGAKVRVFAVAETLNG